MLSIQYLLLNLKLPITFDFYMIYGFYRSVYIERFVTFQGYARGYFSFKLACRKGSMSFPIFKLERIGKIMMLFCFNLCHSKNNPI